MASGTTSLTSEMIAGDGTDVLVMTAADAATASAASAFETKITSFEKLSISDTPTTARTINLANMDDISYVISANSGSAAVAEVFTADFTSSGTIVGIDTIAFNGATINLAANDTAANIATKVAAGSFTNYTAAASGNVVTFTAKVTGATTDAAVGDFTITDTDATTAAASVTVTTEGTVSYTFNTTDLKLNSTGTADTFVIGDYTYTAVADGDDLQDIVADMTGTKVINGVTYAVTSTGTTQLVLTTTSTTAPATLTYTATDVGSDGGTFNAGTGSGSSVSKANAATEVFTANFSTSGAIEDGDTVVFDGVTITLATGMDAAQIAVAVAGQAYANYTASNLGSGVVQFTQKAAGAKTNILASDFTITNVSSTTTKPAVTVAVTTQGAAAGATPNLTLTKMANNGTLELTAAGNGATVTMTDATSLTADIFNIVTKVNTSNVSFGTVAVAGVETVNITATDTSPVDANGNPTISKATMTLSDADVKSVVITGNADLDLTADGASLTSVDGSAMTGQLTFTTAVNNAVIKGGSAADSLTANADDVTLTGNGGNDTLTVNAGADRAILTGGDGADKFVIAGASATSSTYSNITALNTGDVIQFTGATAFAAAKVTLSAGATETTQALMDLAVNNLAANGMGWFQTGGNTFIVMDAGTNSTAGFINAQDMVVMITGLVDLSTASYNATSNTLEIA